MTARSIVLTLIFLATAFSAEAAQRRNKPEEPPPAPVLTASENAPKLKFQTIALGVASGTVIGKRTYGLTCLREFDTIKTTGTVAVDKRAFGTAFRAEFEAANYKVVGDDVALFNEQQNEARYLVGAVVQNFKLEACYQFPTLNTNAKATADLAVEWQFYDPQERKVVFRASTVGSARSSASQDGENQAVTLAFGDALRTLLTTKELHDFLNPVALPPAAVGIAQPAAPLFQLKSIPASTARFQDRATDVRAHVVTIFSNDGSGSGFFINDGYVLTNSHVVAGTKFVKVKLITNREIVGEVVATNAKRDVALVKTETTGLKGLAVRTTEAGIGSQIFVIGSPLDAANQGTVLSGIVSTYRTIEDQPYIQSDVGVQHGNSGGPMVDENGNVIGVTVSGLSINGASASVNFFIPITDALDKLGVALAAN